MIPPSAAAVVAGGSIEEVLKLVALAGVASTVLGAYAATNLEQMVAQRRGARASDGGTHSSQNIGATFSIADVVPAAY